MKYTNHKISRYTVDLQYFNLCLACATRCVTKATSIQFIDGNKLKSCKINVIEQYYVIGIDLKN